MLDKESGLLLSLLRNKSATQSGAYLLLHYAHHCYVFDATFVQDNIALFVGSILAIYSSQQGEAFLLLLMWKLAAHGARQECNALRRLLDGLTARQTCSLSVEACGALQLLFRKQADASFASTMHDDCVAWCSLAMNIALQEATCWDPENLHQYWPNHKEPTCKGLCSLAT